MFFDMYNNYVHFNIDAYFNQNVLSRIFMLGFDLFSVRVLCSLVPKWLINTSSCPQLMILHNSGGEIYEKPCSPVALSLQAPLSLPFLFSPICAKFQFFFIIHLQQLCCRETRE